MTISRAEAMEAMENLATMGLLGIKRALNAPEKAKTMDMIKAWKVEGRPLNSTVGTGVPFINS